MHLVGVNPMCRIVRSIFEIHINITIYNTSDFLTVPAKTPTNWWQRAIVPFEPNGPWDTASVITIIVNARHHLKIWCVKNYLIKDKNCHESEKYGLSFH